MPSPDRLLVVTNPHSTNSHAGSDFLGLLDMYRAPSSYFELETQPGGFDRNVEWIAENILPGDTVVVRGGDGAAHFAANGIIKSEQTDTTALLVLPYGNGNDVALSLYGKDIYEPGFILGLVNNGERRACGGIRVECTGREVRHALGYVGVGATAVLSERFADQGYREAKFKHWLGAVGLGPAYCDFVDGINIFNEFRDSEPFRYEEEGKIKIGREMLYLNAKRVFRFLRAATNSTSDKVLSLELGPKNYIPELLWKVLAESTTTGFKGTTLSKREFTMCTPNMIQFDGEAERLPAGTTVTITPAPGVINMLMPPSRLS